MAGYVGGGRCKKTLWKPIEVKSLKDLGSAAVFWKNMKG
jgi:hypothetical protein